MWFSELRKIACLFVVVQQVTLDISLSLCVCLILLICADSSHVSKGTVMHLEYSKVLST